MERKDRGAPMIYFSEEELKIITQGLRSFDIDDEGANKLIDKIKKYMEDEEKPYRNCFKCGKKIAKIYQEFRGQKIEWVVQNCAGCTWYGDGIMPEFIKAASPNE